MPLYPSLPPDEEGKVGVPTPTGNPPVALPPDDGSGTVPPIPPILPPPPSVPVGGSDGSDAGAGTLPTDIIGDIPPPPIPAAATAGVAGLSGASTFAQPGTTGAKPFRTAAFSNPARGLRFGPGTKVVGAAPAPVAGLDPEEAAALLRRLAEQNGAAGKP